MDNEINANVSQTYTYLKSFDTDNEQLLKDRLEEYEIRKEYKELLEFNIGKFKEDLINNEIHLDEFNNILIKNGIGDFGDFIDFVRNKKSDDRYIDSWFKIIKSNINKLLAKQDNIIKEVIEDINQMNNYTSEYPIKENTILNFNEYLNENINDKRTI